MVRNFACSLRVLLVFLTTSLHAADYIPPMPRDMDKVDMYLQTVGDGWDIAAAFGHTLIRVVDGNNGTDISYNWGVYDFNDPNFFTNFVYGEINYRMAAMSQQNTLMNYRYERRTIVQEKLNLTAMQKTTLMEKIIWSSQPQNLFFPYHYYFSNCSTKVRDNLDAALGGQLSQRFTSAPGAESLRNAIRGHFLPFPFIGTYTEIIMNGDLEAQMTAWQEMFLPGRLQKYLQRLPAFDDAGQEIPGSSLLSEKTELLQYESPAKSPLTGFQIFFIALVPLLIVCGFYQLLKPNSPATAIRIFGFICMIWGTLSGFFGLVMTLLWAFSAHLHGKHNANLLIFWPLDFVWVWYGWRWLYNGSALTVNPRLLLPSICIAHLLTMIIGLILSLSGAIEQDISNILYYLAPITALVCVVSLRFGIRDWNKS